MLIVSRIIFLISLMATAFLAVFPPLYYVIMPEDGMQAMLYSLMVMAGFSLFVGFVFKANDSNSSRLTLRDLNLLPCIFLILMEVFLLSIVASALFAVFAFARSQDIDISLPVSMLVIALTLPGCVLLGAAWTRFGELFTLRFPIKREEVGQTIYWR